MMTFSDNFAFRRIQRTDRLAVAKHGRLVRDRDHFFQLVGNHDAGNALLLQLTQQLQQVLAVVLVERSRRLVQNEQLDVLAERLGNFHELLLADPETP